MTRSILRPGRHRFVLAFALLVAAYSGCGSGAGAEDRPDGGRNGGSSGSTGSGGSSGTAGTNGAGEYGFNYRPLASHTVGCTGDTGTMTTEAADMDLLCTFNATGQKGYVYVRTTVTGAVCFYAASPVHKLELAQISINGVVTDLANPAYDWGGNHHNDTLRFDYQGSSYEYSHSSLGFGGRHCQEMDCINIYAVGGTTPKTEGCTSARTLPEVCVELNSNGTHNPLTDTFTKCIGDPNK